jgi:superfamily I DNA and RNA helicase
MQLNAVPRNFKSDPGADRLISILTEKAEQLKLSDATAYYDFPLYRGEEGEVVTTKVLVVSAHYGVLAFGTSDATKQNCAQKLQRAASVLDQVVSSLFSRLILNKSLRAGPTRLALQLEAALFAPFVEDDTSSIELAHTLLLNEKGLIDYFESHVQAELSPEIFNELVSTVEGAKGLIRPKRRDSLPSAPANSKGHQVANLEAEIASFDQRQKRAAMQPLDGPQRIRGLAGSGKTVVMAMKAALTHLREPNAKILYTFSTKSLYQHIQRLVTRFYRQFDDHDPDWDRLKIMHAWGGKSTPGVYFNAALASGVRPISYGEANNAAPGKEFDFVCGELMKSGKVVSNYDFVFVDEGQDFTLQFLRLCRMLAKEDRFVYAYDDLQTIFQASTPTAVEVFGKGVDLDTLTLFKCYRNPREVIVCAHALGFGIYSEHIVQMLQNKEHWEDIGYVVNEGSFVSGSTGDFVEGSAVVIERPEENSLKSISEASGLEEIVKAASFDSPIEELNFVATQIEKDIGEGLRPEDILVIVLDDRNARRYLEMMSSSLKAKGIRTNNVHGDVYGLQDFSVEDQVTLSTVHKAKGNEAYMVYIVGVDYVFTFPDPRRRNMLFTAMTRAKAWVRVSGIGAHAKQCVMEIEAAKQNFPLLKFNYPTAEAIKVMKRDLEEAASQKQKNERLLAELSELSDEEIASLLSRQKAAKKKKF